MWREFASGDEVNLLRVRVDWKSKDKHSTTGDRLLTEGFMCSKVHATTELKHSAVTAAALHLSATLTFHKQTCERTESSADVASVACWDMRVRIRDGCRGLPFNGV